MTPEFVDTKRAAIVLSIGESTVRKLIADGRLQRFKFGAATRVRLADVLAWAALQAAPARSGTLQT